MPSVCAPANEHAASTTANSKSVWLVFEIEVGAVIFIWIVNSRWVRMARSALVTLILATLRRATFYNRSEEIQLEVNDYVPKSLKNRPSLKSRSGRETGRKC